MIPWHEQIAVRRAAGIVLATLTLWISEVAPLGIVAMAIPIAATFTGLLTWKEAVAAWGDEIIFLFLGAFLLARALEKHGVFDVVLSTKWLRPSTSGSIIGVTLVVLLASGLISTMQNNTAVTAMMLPVVLVMARRTKSPAPIVLALAWGATFGGIATPVGTAPNFIGYAAIKKIDPDFSFVQWMRVGVPVWLGITAIGWTVLMLTRRASRKTPGPSVDPEAALTEVVKEDHAPIVRDPAAQRWVLVAFAMAVLLWIVPGLIRSMTPSDHPAAEWIGQYLPESLVPIAVAWMLFLIRIGPDRKTLLDRHDFQLLDWDTLFLIAGGLCMGRMFESSGLARELATSLAGVNLPPLVLMLGLVGCTVILSELTSNTATANLMVPIAKSLAIGLSISQVQAIWLVAMAASLGFALPVSTPPNAIVYGTRLIPLRYMALTGIMVDILSTIWLVCCMTLWG